MNLFQVIRRYLALTLLVVLIIGCVTIFFVFKAFINLSTDQTLYEYKDRIVNYTRLNDTLIIFKSSLQIPQRIESEIIHKSDSYVEGIKDTLLYNEATGYFQPHRQLSFIITYNHNPHLITINQPSIEMQDLLYVILGSLVAIFILFITFTYFIDYNLKRKVWAPFYKTLFVLKNYDLEQEFGKSIHFQDSGIKEFDMLNNTVQRMVSKINYDYENMKMFSEDISHEMQTPLAIIKSKIEILRQKDSSDNQYYESLLAMSRSVTRLSKLNSSLLLLTKITNDQYLETSLVDLSLVMNQQLEALDELIEIKNIKLHSEINQSVHVLNVVLADILISNLVNNAIRHNVEYGFIKIHLDNEVLQISNSCEISGLENLPDLFGRLVSLKAEGSGLGLSIVKSICDKSNISVSYDYSESNTFNIMLRFLPTSLKS